MIERRDDVTRALGQARVMALALASGVLTLAAVVVFLLTSGSPPDWIGSLDPSLLPWVAGGAVVILLLAPRVGRRIAAGAPPDRGAVVGAWTAGHLVAAGLREAVGIAGLVFGLLAGSLPWALGFAAASVAALLLGIPRADALEERLRWVERADGAAPG